MTNREMFLLATTILFASTTAGMAFKGMMCHHSRPGMERMDEGRFGPRGPEGRPDGDRQNRGDRMFDETDTNKDGFVTKDEMLAKQQARLDDMFTTVDTNHDGKLSKDEMEKGRELMHAKFKAKFEAEHNKGDNSDAAPAPASAPEAAPAPAPAQ